MGNWIKRGMAALLVVPGLALAEPHEAPLRELAENEIKAWATDPAIIAAIKAQNSKHDGISQRDIDALDQKWRAETAGSTRPFIDDVLASEVSQRLKQVKDESAGLYTEIFVMDSKGLNVGQSDVTSDYWQGDEAKWKETFLVGPTAVHVSEVEQDESTQVFQAQVSMAIADPETNEVIGAVTVGVDIEQVLQ